MGNEDRVRRSSSTEHSLIIFRIRNEMFRFAAQFGVEAIELHLAKGTPPFGATGLH